MTKKLFIESIEALKKQQEHDDKCNDAFQIILSDCFTTGYTNYYLSSQILKILAEEMNDKNEWIEYFCYELDFGKKYKKGCVTEADGTPINISTASKLYDFLKK